MDANYRYYEQSGIGIFEFLRDKLIFDETTGTVDDIKNIIAKKNLPSFIFNLKKISTIDSVGIGYFIAIKNAASKKSSNLLLVSESELVLKVLHITRMDSFFKIFRSMDEAVASASALK
ncbi:MAG TPA: STAS domain-containing protein [Spirochaetota bacterium]|jgi:anti-anti-sigma factor|nr:STAS domain-containing protein [Spirochaetota bacterium]